MKIPTALFTALIGLQTKFVHEHFKQPPLLLLITSLTSSNVYYLPSYQSPAATIVGVIPMDPRIEANSPAVITYPIPKANDAIYKIIY